MRTLEEASATVEECDRHLAVLSGMLRDETDELLRELLMARTNLVLERRVILKRRRDGSVSGTRR